jgi:hypothetical protein
MNKRIKELVGRAKFMAEETINKQISKNAELDAFAEKLAELIVRECALVVHKKTGPKSALNVLEHFGVEE